MIGTNWTEVHLRRIIIDLLESIGHGDGCDCGGSPLCPICRAHEAVNYEQDKDTKERM